MSTQENFVDYYAVLQVWPTASESIIKKAYFSLAKLHHPDVSAKDENADEGSAVDFKMVNEAYTVLIDPIKRREYDESFKRYGRTGQGKRDADKRSARLAYEQAKTAIKHERFDKAAVLLRSAIKYDETNALYCSWYGFCLAALNTNLHEARDYCK
ncbi:MAG: J domain-containing protein, partial [Chitinivibrionia bacterium]|nr:J domain-containing protein [Chitinivibrionia bacterium]